MEKFPYKRGSEWRRWDLHLHTPGTLKEDSFRGTTIDEKWENFCTDINSSEAEIAVVGITDYLLLDNYRKFRSLIEQGKITKKIDFVLPNIELRITPITADGCALNLHLLIDPSFIDQADSRIYSKLILKNGNTQYAATKSDLIRLGKTINSSLSDEDAYKEGAKKFVIDFDSLKEVFDNDVDLKRHCLIAVSNRSGDGATGITEHSTFFTGNSSDLDIKRQSVYKLSDIIFSATPNDRTYFLGKGIDSTEKVTEKCGSLKPCIHGCDAHSSEKIFNPDQQRYCWVKADPDFEGLKQVVYEPEDRVAIQELKPEEKSSYQIIDKVSFNDDDFVSDEILVNQNLTVVIGGKSTGKSILLRNIAKTIDPNEVAKRLGEVGISEYGKEVSDFNVTWADGQENKKNQGSGLNKKIIYIPQSYLNRLIDTDGQTSIDEIIKSVLEQDDDVKKTFDDVKGFERENEKSIAKLVDDIFFFQEDARVKEQEIKELGDKVGIETEIKRLKRELNFLKKKAGITEEDIKRYDDLSQEIAKIQKGKDLLIKDLKTLEFLKQGSSFGVVALSDLSDGVRENLERDLLLINQEASSKWIIAIENQVAPIKEALNLKDKELNKQKLDIAPLIEKIKESESLDLKTDELHKQEGILKNILEQEKSLLEINEKHSQSIQGVIDSYGKFYSKLFEARSKIINQRIINGDLSFDLRIVFKSRLFNEQFVDAVLDGRKTTNFKDVILENYSAESNVQHDLDISKILNAILTDKIALKTSFSKKEAIAKLTKKWWEFDYKILQGGDEISQMSQGKKSFVLLKLLIELDGSRCPILLDQPEDDLDNRSIYNDLVRFIKEKKKQRQIIIATHNPNLVVGADAELVIVANQHGEKTKNTRDTKFEYVEGSLENSFDEKSDGRILYRQGIQEHVCDILEGGKEAFDKRKSKYNFST